MDEQSLDKLIHEAFRDSFTDRNVEYEQWTLLMCGEVASELHTYRPKSIELLLPHVMLWCLKNKKSPTGKGYSITWNCSKDDIVSDVIEYLDIGDWALRDIDLRLAEKREFGNCLIADEEIERWSSTKKAFSTELSREKKRAILEWLLYFRGLHLVDECKTFREKTLEYAIIQWKGLLGNKGTRCLFLLLDSPDPGAC